MSQGLLPNVRPNYEYFNRLLALDTMVAVRPKSCWIFVSSGSLRVDFSREPLEIYDAMSNSSLPHDQYPHLEKNRDPGEAQKQILKDRVLLQEYTHAVEQQDSYSLKETAEKWAEEFPELYGTWDLPAADDDILIFDMNVTLELSPYSQFPAGSDLNGFLEMSIEQPGFESHVWQCVTRLVRPPELCKNPRTDEQLVVKISDLGRQYHCSHRQPGKSDMPECQCRSQNLRQNLRVPFLAAYWAPMLSECASYPDVARDDREQSRAELDEDVQPTAGELLGRVAMLQELWSAPHTTAPGKQKQWTRKALLLWRFQTTRSKFILDNDGKRAAVQPKTLWRFLSINDPTSEHHQSQIYLSPSENTPQLPAQYGLLPSPSYHSLGGPISDNFQATWDNSHITLANPPQHPHLTSMSGVGNNPSQHPHLAGLSSVAGLQLSYLDYSHGLATPPPSASVHGSYPGSFDTTDIANSQHVSFSSAGCHTPNETVGDISSTSAGSYLTGSTAQSSALDMSQHPAGTTFDEEGCPEPGMQEWEVVELQVLGSLNNEGTDAHDTTTGSFSDHNGVHDTTNGSFSDHNGHGGHAPAMWRELGSALPSDTLTQHDNPWVEVPGENGKVDGDGGMWARNVGWDHEWVDLPTGTHESPAPEDMPVLTSELKTACDVPAADDGVPRNPRKRARDPSLDAETLESLRPANAPKLSDGATAGAWMPVDNTKEC